jgi:hypothetical protein
MRGRLKAAAAAIALWSSALAGTADAAPVKTDNLEEREEFVLGNVIFVLFHEVGHALVSEFELPVLGREEDAVDRFATFLLTPEGDEEEEDDPSTILVDAMSGWFLSSNQTELADIQWWDEHGPDQQRAYQIACLLYGADPEKFKKMAQEVELPEDRRESCPFEAESNSASWVKVVEPHVLDDGEKPSKRITVTYGAPGEYRSERDLLKESGLLEAIAEEMTTAFRLPRNLTISAKKCGEPNAFWDSEEAEIQMCYELVREYREMFDQAKKKS